MASFMVELWESIFTPGPTAPLLKAANASFAALQLVLLLLYVATYSVHCIALSVICAGLWWSVNWFAAELRIAQLREAEEKKKEKETNKGKDEGGSDTEVEIVSGNAGRKDVGEKVSASAEVEVQEDMPGLKKRSGAEVSTTTTQSSVSTEDEWEKVSESEKEKDK